MKQLTKQQYWAEVGKIVLSYTENKDNPGRFGRSFEAMVNAIASGFISRSKPSGKTDTIVKGGVALESKTNRGELRSDYPSEQAAKKALKAFYAGASVMKNATHVAYCFMPNGTLNDLERARVFSRTAFEKIIRDNKLGIVSKGSNGNWRIVIQRYYPTGRPKLLPNGEVKRYSDGTPYDTFAINPDRSIAIIRALTEQGESIKEYTKRMNGETGYELYIKRHQG